MCATKNASRTESPLFKPSRNASFSSSYARSKFGKVSVSSAASDSHLWNVACFSASIRICSCILRPVCASIRSRRFSRNCSGVSPCASACAENNPSSFSIASFRASGSVPSMPYMAANAAVAPCHFAATSFASCAFLNRFCIILWTRPSNCCLYLPLINSSNSASMSSPGSLPSGSSPPSSEPT